MRSLYTTFTVALLTAAGLCGYADPAHALFKSTVACDSLEAKDESIIEISVSFPPKLQNGTGGNAGHLEDPSQAGNANGRYVVISRGCGTVYVKHYGTGRRATYQDNGNGSYTFLRPGH
ncbi:MAG: hypothetical protein AB7L92_05770 [Alphaproteobacteria bacterium]